MFITLEGIEGSGKTTQIPHIARYLETRGLQYRITREPGGTSIGQRIRAILLDPDNRQLDPLTELLLYMADRAQHIREIIQPELASGKAVVCDRYFDATVAYQGYARQLHTELIKTLHQLLFSELTPDITLLLDVSPQTGLSRAWKQIQQGQRQNSETRFEKEAMAFHERVRNGYLTLAKLDPMRFRIIDSEQEEEAVTHQIIRELTTVLA